MAPPRMNFQRKTASLDQQSLSSYTNPHVHYCNYDLQGTGLVACLQKAACEALREYTYRKDEQ